jgi:hypothetical protein
MGERLRLVIRLAGDEVAFFTNRPSGKKKLFGAYL